MKLINLSIEEKLKILNWAGWKLVDCKNGYYWFSYKNEKVLSPLDNAMKSFQTVEAVRGKLSKHGWNRQTGFHLKYFDVSGQTDIYRKGNVKTYMYDAFLNYCPENSNTRISLKTINKNL